MKLVFIRPGESIRLLQDVTCNVTPWSIHENLALIQRGTVLLVRRMRLLHYESSIKFRIVNCNIIKTEFWVDTDEISKWEIEKIDK
jgi:hypothetical protein